MNIIDTTIKDVKIIEPIKHGDSRGYFQETFNKKAFQTISNSEFIQDNESFSQKNILRGLHIQTENTQGKLVRVLEGEVFDVAVDCRKGSKTLGQYVGIFLSEKNNKQLWIPEGFAHGFLVISDLAKFSYKCTDRYNPEHEHTILWSDIDLNIQWPIKAEPILSKKDMNGIAFKEFMKKC